jgi:hypothetical protein
MRQPQNDDLSRGRHAGPPYSPVDRYDQVDRPPSRVDRPPSRKDIPWRLVGIGLAVVIVILGVATASSKQFRHQVAISIVRQPTPYTQLYFTSPAALPEKLKADHKNTFEFTIENDEARTYRYTYVVTLEDSRSHLVVSKTAVTMSNGDRVTRLVTVAPKDRKSEYLITITLEGMNQSIHFYGQTS